MFDCMSKCTKIIVAKALSKLIVNAKILGVFYASIQLCMVSSIYYTFATFNVNLIKGDNPPFLCFLSVFSVSKNSDKSHKKKHIINSDFSTRSIHFYDCVMRFDPRNLL